jgi:hypothetical protein
MSLRSIDLAMSCVRERKIEERGEKDVRKEL